MEFKDTTGMTADQMAQEYMKMKIESFTKEETDKAAAAKEETDKVATAKKQDDLRAEISRHMK